MELLLFLFQVFGISLSGALAPGPVTAAAITLGARHRFAGTLMALSGDAVERVPLEKIAGEKRPLVPDLYRLAGVLSALPDG